jgi:hypothetical protein
MRGHPGTPQPSFFLQVLHGTQPWQLLQALATWVLPGATRAGCPPCAWLRLLLCSCTRQVFSSEALPRGSFGYWLLIVFVGTTITVAIAIMILLVIFESFRAFKFATLYEDVRWVLCGCLRGVMVDCGGGARSAQRVPQSPIAPRVCKGVGPVHVPGRPTEAVVGCRL